MFTALLSQSPSATHQPQQPIKQPQAHTVMADSNDTIRDTDSPSTPKRDNSSDASKHLGIAGHFVSPHLSNNKRTKFRGDDPMEETKKVAAAKKPGTSTAAIRIKGIAAKAAVQKKGGAATPGATTGGATSFLSPRATLGLTMNYGQKLKSKPPESSKFKANFKQFL